MLAWCHIEAIIQRHLILQFRDLYRLFDVFFWPLVDILLWGFTAIWLEHDNNQETLHAILLGLILWQILYRSSLELAMNMLQELWDRNLAHLFSTPLTLLEWIAATLILSVIRVFLYLCVYAIMIWYLYGFNTLPFFIPLIPHGLLLLCSGWSLGFFCCALLIYSGQKAQAFVLPITWVLMPLTGVFYPITLLPPLMQAIARWLPPSYIFENMRTYLSYNAIEYHQLFICGLLNIVYLIFTLLLFILFFRKGKQYGFARLE